MSGAFEDRVRVEIYREFVRTSRAPSAERLAEVMETPLSEIRGALDRLHAGKAIYLQPSNREILLAAPLCTVPTPFLVHAGDKSYFGTCIWDALGILAMLHRDGTVETSCGCCGEAMSVEIRDGAVHGGGIIHFALPAKQWWANIVYT